MSLTLFHICSLLKLFDISDLTEKLLRGITKDLIIQSTPLTWDNRLIGTKVSRLSGVTCILKYKYCSYNYLHSRTMDNNSLTKINFAMHSI